MTVTGNCFHHRRLDGRVAEASGAVVAIGNFDGVHLGHRAVLDMALELAREADRPAWVLSFEPHPRTLFNPDAPVFRLTPEAEKARILAALGFDGLAVLPFTHETAALSASDFVTLITERMEPAHLVAGFDFHFGRKREGTPEALVSLARGNGMDATIVAEHADAGGAVSSSRIRRLLGAGNVAAAAESLGHRWAVSGEIVRGQQLGRTLGYPTANIVPHDIRLEHGIYAVRFRREDSGLHDGVASWGRRPTFDNGPAWLETYLFDFSGDLYGEHCTVSFFERLRGEERFDSAEALTEQMRRDEAAARDHLAGVKPLTSLDRVLNFR